MLIQPPNSVMRDALLSYDVITMDETRLQFEKNRENHRKAKVICGFNEVDHPIIRSRFLIMTLPEHQLRRLSCLEASKATFKQTDTKATTPCATTMALSSWVVGRTLDVSSIRIEYLLSTMMPVIGWRMR